MYGFHNHCVRMKATTRNTPNITQAVPSTSNSWGSGDWGATSARSSRKGLVLMDERPAARIQKSTSDVKGTLPLSNVGGARRSSGSLHRRPRRGRVGEGDGGGRE